MFPLFLSAQIVKKDNGRKGAGFKDSRGNWIVKPEYKDAHWDKYTPMGVLENSENKWGAVDEYGKIIIPFEFDKIVYRLSNFRVTEYVHVVKNTGGLKNYGLWSIKRGLIVPCKYASVSDYDKAITVRNHDGQYGLYDYNGNQILDAIYSNFICFSNDRPEIQLLSTGGKWGAVDSKGNIIIPCVYDECVLTENEIYPVKKNGKWGYYAFGREIISCIYNNAFPFKNDVAQVREGNKIKLIKNPLKDDNTIALGHNSSMNVATPIRQKNDRNSRVISRYPAPNSDIDKNIPTVKTNEKSNKFVFIIANENYPDAPVPYALNDGRIFKEYCLKTLGLPEKNVFIYEDATFGTIISAVEKLKEIALAYDGDASVILYYAGHGVPDEKNNSAYILPVDGSSSDIETTGYSLAKLYKELSALNLKSTKVFLDACFSGAKREDEMLLSGRGVAIKVKDEVPQGNMVVFSASTGDETAHQLEEKGHGLFTYFLLKKLQETNGNVTFGELSDYVTRQVKRQSVVINNKKQTPTVIPSPKIVNTWREEKLK